MSDFRRFWGILKYRAGERVKQKTGTTHAALEGVGKRKGRTPTRTSVLSLRALISLPDRPVVERSPCVHDNTMHTNHTDYGSKHCLVCLVTPGVTRGQTKKSHDGAGAKPLVCLVTPIPEKVKVRSARPRAPAHPAVASTFARNGVTRQTSGFIPAPSCDYLVTPRGNEPGNEPISLPLGVGA